MAFSENTTCKTSVPTVLHLRAGKDLAPFVQGWIVIYPVDSIVRRVVSAIHWKIQLVVLLFILWVVIYPVIVNRGTGYETLELSEARTMLLQSMLN